MAQHQYDLVLGGHDEDVVLSAGGSISTSAVRVTVDTANALTKDDAVQSLQYVINRILEGTWPPA
jgi:hypothetical protein